MRIVFMRAILLRSTGLSIVWSPQFIRERPEMSDPLTEVIALLRPRAVFAKRISGAGRWGVRYPEYGEPSFCTVLEGSCRLAVDGEPDHHARGGRLRAAAGDARRSRCRASSP